MHYVGQTFTNQHIVLDDNVFEACVFENCTLIHQGGAFQIINGFRVVGNVKFNFADGEATLKMLDLIGRNLGYLDIMGRIYRADDQATADRAMPNQ